MPSEPHEPAPTKQSEFLWHFTRDVERLRAYVFTLLPNADDADDIFQKTSMVLWEKFDQFDRGRSFFHWACGIAFHLVLNFRRVKGRDRLVFNDDLLGAIAQTFIQRNEHDQARQRALSGCVQKLSSRERQLVDQRYGRPGTLKELAEQVGRPVKGLYKQLDRIRRKLLECVERALLKQGIQGDVDAD